MTSEAHRPIVEAAVASVREGKPFADVVAEALGSAAEAAPSPVWEELGGVDTAADVAKAAPWLARQFQDRPPPDDLSGLWFSINLVRGAVPGRNEAVVALSGGPGYPEEGWLAKQTWDAAGYAPAAGLRRLLPSVAAESAEVRALVSGPVVFAYALGLAVALLDAVDAAAALGARERLGVAVGVPDGDTVHLGELTAAGLDRSQARLEAAPEPEPEPEETPAPE